jgi:hypothetical protein
LMCAVLRMDLPRCNLAATATAGLKRVGLHECWMA